MMPITTRHRWRKIGAGALLVAVAFSSGSVAQTKHGYLAPDAFDIMKVLPRAPVPGSARYKSDRRIFKGTRKLLDTPRGALATNDVSEEPADMLQDYACSLGVSLTPEIAPKTVYTITRAAIDTAAQKNRAKSYFKRSRPYKIDNGPICQPHEEVDDSFDYPSGHTTWGWTWALILTDLAPDRATQILARGRAYGQSRFVCGVHNESAVEAGWLTADATMAVIRTRPGYQANLAEARSELNNLRHDPSTPRPKNCAAQAKLVTQNVLP